jgi:hypothetical protein
MHAPQKPLHLRKGVDEELINLENADTIEPVIDGPIAPESRYVTTFSTHRGLFRYKRLNFGMNCAAEIFNDVIRQTVSRIPGMVNRSDDIFVTGKKIERYSNLEKVLSYS